MLRIVNKTKRISSGCSRLYKDLAPDFFAAAHRAFASKDSFFLADGLIGFRAVAFLAGGAAFLEADLPFCFAHRVFCAAEIWHVQKHSSCVSQLLIAKTWADDPYEGSTLQARLSRHPIWSILL